MFFTDRHGHPDPIELVSGGTAGHVISMKSVSRNRVVGQTRVMSRTQLAGDPKGRLQRPEVQLAPHIEQAA